MRVLVVGGAGMLGHKVWQLADARFETWGTRADRHAGAAQSASGDPQRTCVGVDAFHFETAGGGHRSGAAGCGRQLRRHCQAAGGAKDPMPSIAINALLPHLLARACAARGARLVQISTDCVFDGRGRLRRGRPPDAADLYGRSKMLGEVTGSRLSDAAHVDHRPRTHRTLRPRRMVPRPAGADRDGYRGADLHRASRPSNWPASCSDVLERAPRPGGPVSCVGGADRQAHLLDLLDAALRRAT